MFRPFVKINVLFTLISLAAACGSPTSSAPAIATVVRSPTNTQSVVPKVTLSVPIPSLAPPPPAQIPTSTHPPTALFQKSDQEFGDGTTFSIALGDIDNDGDLDALVANFDSRNQV